MEKKPQNKRRKPHFCYDVNLQFKYLNKECNKLATFTSSVTLLKNEEASDRDILDYCCKHDYHIITHNKHNFKDYQNDSKVGIVYIGNQDPKYWLNKFKSLMRKYSDHQDLHYKTINIVGNVIEEIDRIIGDGSQIAS